jgi:16S rRNA (cytidine1402-2'-O)-methyltransferase
MTRRRQSKRAQDTAQQRLADAVAASTGPAAKDQNSLAAAGVDEGADALSDATGEAPSRGQKLPAGLYLAATPIGAARDVTLHVLDALAHADVIAAEDTRRAQTLMAIHGIARAGRRLIPYHDHNGAAQRPDLLARIAAGESVVCISDAGTPLVADPGWRLAREAIDLGLMVRALPGASALLAALSVSGLPTDRFLFAGFLPPKQAARRAELTELAPIQATLVFYESPRRLGDLLADIALTLGPDRQASVSRELTKKFEETVRGTVAELTAIFTEPPRGEIVVCVGPPIRTEPQAEDVDTALREALANHKTADAARLVAQRLGMPRRDVYARALALEDAKESDR